MYADMWDEIESGMPPTKPLQPDKQAGTGTTQDFYYDYLDDTEGEEPQVLSEPQASSEPQVLTEKESFTTPNPVYPDSAGPDFATTPPVWASEELLTSVEDLKNKLFDVENRLAKEMGGGEKWHEKVHDPDHKKTMDEIESLKQRIEKVSSTLGTDHERSPWVVKRD
jgi:hypothetical protein